MKTNGTRVLIIALFLYLSLVVLSFTSYAQPDYDFSTGSLISGSDRAVGGQYRFTNVKPGVDAIVTITAITGGISLNNIDGNSGFKEAFQPVIQVPAFTSGYAEFQIDFVTATTFSPRVMLEVPLTCIDVDGQMYSGLPVNEFDMVKRTSGIYVDFNMLGGELNVSFDPTWIIGTNTGTIDYPGVDTIAKQAMFSTVSANISSTTIRVGANNLSSHNVQRLRSVYFKKFSFTNSFLAKSPLLSFRGTEKNRKVELQWELEANHGLSSIVIEKSKGGSNFTAIGEVWVNLESKTKNSMQYIDQELLEGLSLYRLKMISANGAVQYSNVLSFRGDAQQSSSFKVYPSAIQTSATINIQAGKAGPAVFEMVDYAGRIVHRQHVNVQQGNNNIQLNSIGNVIGGNYVAVLKIDNSIYTQKILKK